MAVVGVVARKSASRKEAHVYEQRPAYHAGAVRTLPLLDSMSGWNTELAPTAGRR